MTTTARPPSGNRRFDDLERFVYDVLARRQDPSVASGTSAPSAAGPNLRDMADTAITYVAKLAAKGNGAVLRYKASTGKWEAQAFPSNVEFSFAGALAATTSPKHPVQAGAHIVRVMATLLTAGSTSTVLTLMVNGANQTPTITFGTSGAGSTFQDVTFDFTVNATDVVQVAITTAGTGAKDLVVNIIGEMT